MARYAEEFVRPRTCCSFRPHSCSLARGPNQKVGGACRRRTITRRWLAPRRLISRWRGRRRSAKKDNKYRGRQADRGIGLILEHLTVRTAASWAARRARLPTRLNAKGSYPVQRVRRDGAPWRRACEATPPPVKVFVGSGPWHRKPGFELIAMKDVRHLTCLEPRELLGRPKTQQLTRTDESVTRPSCARARTRRRSEHLGERVLQFGEHLPAVDDERLPGDVARLRRGQEANTPTDVMGSANSPIGIAASIFRLCSSPSRRGPQSARCPEGLR